MKTKLIIILAILLIFSGVLLAKASPVLATTPANITINVPSQPVNPGDSFDVTLTITNTVAIFGWQLDVNYDNSKLTYNSLTEGTFLNDNGTTISGGTPDATTDPGTIAGIAYCLTGKAIAPAGTNGLLATLSFTVNAGASGAVNFHIANILLLDSDANSIQGVTYTDASFTIGMASTTTSTTTTTTSTPTASTTPTTTTTNSNSPTITGFSPSSGSTGTIVTITGTNFNGTTSVKFGNTYTNYFIVSYSGTQITATVGNGSSGPITVIYPYGIATSSDDFVFNGDNSTGTTTTIPPASSTTPHEPTETTLAPTTTTICLPPPITTTTTTTSVPSDELVDSTLGSKLTFIAPASVGSWNLTVTQNNNAMRSLMVFSNTNWQVTVQDINSITDGHLTQYDGSRYFIYQLSNPLTITASTGDGIGNSIDLSIGGILCSGTPAGQNADNGGDLRTIIFNQPVTYTDPTLASGYSYHIVITFTASSSSY